MSSSSQRAAPSRSSPTGGLGRFLVGVLSAFGGFLAMGWLLISALDSSEQKYGTVELDVVSAVHDYLGRAGDYSGPPRVVYLGDSLSMPSQGRSITKKLGRILADRHMGDAEPPGVVNVSAPGLTAFSHYFLSEKLAGLGADRFIVGINLGWFSRGQHAQQPSMVGLLPASRWPEVFALPLRSLGISADEIITSRALMHSGLLETWRSLQREQVRLRHAVRRAASSLLRALGLPNDQSYPRRIKAYHHRSRTRAGRPTEAGARKRLARILAGLPADDPNLAVLDALVGRLRASGARVLLVVPPTNVEALNELGVYNREGVQASMARIRDVAARNDADFLDLHALLPDAAFRDANDHLASRSKSRPTHRIASQLVLWAENQPDWDRLRPDPDVLGNPAAR
ncbi:MAG: SGNH/GDSL hydrolase family protein [Candidatus Binatia bacterium]|nr:SGNH/GDSL hydrolase family protein [Candidatus Binatia bacterium]